jgi:formylglycine-generating enzyme required for sulfatase activity
VVSERLERFATDVGVTDPDVVRWRGKQSRVAELERKLAALGDANAIVPANCQKLYQELVKEVSVDDVRVGKLTQRFKQVQEVEAALAPVDRMEPLPGDVLASLERSAKLYGDQDPVHIRRTDKVRRVGELKQRLGRLEAVVAESATDMNEDRAAFDELVAKVGANDGDIPRFARRLVQIMGPGRPAWASGSGRDDSGLWADCSVRGNTMRFRFCPPGRTILGSPDGESGRDADEVPVPVTFSKGCWIAESECTQALWSVIMGENPSRLRGPQRPVERVSYDDVRQFLTRLSAAASGLPARLPSEAEWEYACRAGMTTAWSAQSGDKATADKVAWYLDNSGASTHDVKLRFANALGLYDMHGNVWEWCEDRYGAYPTSAVDDWLGRDGLQRVVRGGSWGDMANATRAANRQPARDDLRSAYVGFRIVVTAEWATAPDGNALIAQIQKRRHRVEWDLGVGKVTLEVDAPPQGAVDGGKAKETQP